MTLPDFYVSPNGLAIASFVLLGMTSLAFGAPQATPAERMAESSDRILEFNSGWRFHLGEVEGAEQPGFNDSEWRSLDLPHDWSIELAHDKDTPEGNHVGYLRGGTGWYRKTFTLAPAETGQRTEVIFDGVQQDCEVWINGHSLGLQPHGYVGFHYDLSAHLRPAGEPNVLAVRAINPDRNTRWYAGSGIYRNVALRVRSAVDVTTWGLLIDTLWLEKDKAQLHLRAELRNDCNVSQRLEVALRLQRPDGSSEDMDLGQIVVAAHSTEEISQQVTVNNPSLWSPETPVLYTAELRLLQRGKHVGGMRQRFGIRTVAVSANEGFRLNGKPVELKGACMHHDNGLIGAAAFPTAERRRVAVMKQNGYNAIRTSHNPPSTAFLDACDELGMLVIDEFTDIWEMPKKPNGYNRYFIQHWEKDLRAMLRRDFNHPSVIMWSIGNEIAERSRPAGLEIGRRMVACVRSLDRRRPITNAMNPLWDNPDWGQNWDLSAPGFELLDVGGYNYTMDQYETDHVKHPQRIMVGTESYPKLAHGCWQFVEKHPYVIGDFVWTGMDHIGESGIGHTTYIPAGSRAQQGWLFMMPWPTWINWCGDIDLIGNKKPQSFYRDVVWNRSPVELAVHEPIPEGKEEWVGEWGWPAELQSWNWPGLEGRALSVRVFSKSPRVRLELNGRIIGEKAVEVAKDIAVTFDVPYEGGELKAVALSDTGAVVGSRSLITTGAVARFTLTPELADVRAGRGHLIYVPIEAVDSANRHVGTAALPVSVKVRGPVELLAIGSANPESMLPLREPQTRLFRGRALLVLRSTGKPGEVQLTVESAGVEAAAVKLTVPE